MEAWEDADGDGELSPCDIAYFDGAACHLMRVGRNITITPVDNTLPVPTMPNE